MKKALLRARRFGFALPITLLAAVGGACGAPNDDGPNASVDQRVWNPPPGGGYASDGRKDIVWKHGWKQNGLWKDADADPQLSLWHYHSDTTVDMSVVAADASNLTPIAEADFWGDHSKGLLLCGMTSQDCWAWKILGATVIGKEHVGSKGATWTFAGTYDLDGDGRSDVVWLDPSTGVHTWLMNGGQHRQVDSNPGTARYPIGVGALDGVSPYLVQVDDLASTVSAVRLTSAGTTAGAEQSIGSIPSGWHPIPGGVSDVDGDGKADIFWQHDDFAGPDSGLISMWLMDGIVPRAFPTPARGTYPWTVAEIADYDGDRRADLLWRNTSTGEVSIWFFDPSVNVRDFARIGGADCSWSIAANRGSYVTRSCAPLAGPPSADRPAPLAGAPSVTSLLIVAPRSFAAALAPLVAHKNAVGTPAFVVAIEDVRALPPTSGRDDAAKLKSVLAYAAKGLGMRYVMLAGDASVIPTQKYAITDLESDPTTQWTGYYYEPTDFYYANLFRSSVQGGARDTFSDWDADGDGKYDHANGPYTPPGQDNVTFNPDKVDAYADIAVGRLNAHVASDLTTYVASVIRYESMVQATPLAARQTFFADGEYGTSVGISESVISPFNAAVVARTGSAPASIRKLGVWFADQAAWNAAAQPGWTLSTTGTADIVASFGSWQWMTYTGHGGPSGWGEAYELRMGAVPYVSGTPPIVYVSGCETATLRTGTVGEDYYGVDGKHHFINADTTTRTAFDNAQGVVVPYPVVFVEPSLYDDPANYTPALQRARISWMTLKGSAIAYIGSTQTTQDNKPARLQKYLMVAYANGASTLGDAFVAGQRGYLADPVDRGSYFGDPRVFLNYMELIGDPSLQIR